MTKLNDEEYDKMEELLLNECDWLRERVERAEVRAEKAEALYASQLAMRKADEARGDLYLEQKLYLEEQLAQAHADATAMREQLAHDQGDMCTMRMALEYWKAHPQMAKGMGDPSHLLWEVMHQRTERALKPDAGKALLARLEKLERVAEAAQQWADAWYHTGRLPAPNSAEHNGIIVALHDMGDKIKRKPGCRCTWEEGDSTCPLHGEDEEVKP